MINLKAGIIGFIGIIITTIIIFQIVGGTAGSLVAAGQNVSEYNATATDGVTGAGNMPLSALFSSGGIIFIVLMASILILVFGIVMKFKA